MNIVMYRVYVFKSETGDAGPRWEGKEVQVIDYGPDGSRIVTLAVPDGGRSKMVADTSELYPLKPLSDPRDVALADIHAAVSNFDPEDDGCLSAIAIGKVLEILKGVGW